MSIIGWMSGTELLILLVLVGAIFYWIDTIRTKEIATQHGKKRCEKLAVTFLDQTVEIKKVRLKRNPRGTLSFKREYGFEFSSDGVRRFDGEIVMLGKILESLSMSAYPEPVTASIKSDVKPESTVVNIESVKTNNETRNKFPTGFK